MKEVIVKASDTLRDKREMEALWHSVSAPLSRAPT
jgi:hypothetical protein